ncbi:hypothetical protein F2Q68_00035411 [Brassica cretica]|uniref:Uncharacterized protein n=1 Tax=Brassica cretica TaxID=69181 RepID=A0A8S9H796_BRACR|nr:hypothetical protein F2Q68_00035411 [Brassica cretica]
MVASIVLIEDATANLNDQEGRLRNPTGQKIDDQGLCMSSSTGSNKEQTLLFFRSCTFRMLNPQGKTHRIDRQQHQFVDRHSPSTVDRDYSSVDRLYPPDIDGHSTSYIDQY